MDESTERLMNTSSIASSISSSGQGSFNVAAFSDGEQMEDDIANYLSRLSPTSKRRLDEFVQVTDYSMAHGHFSHYQVNQNLVPQMPMGNIIEVEENPQIPEVNFAIGSEMQYNFGSTPQMNFDYGDNDLGSHYLQRGRPVTMYEPFRELDQEFSSLPPDLISSNVSIDNEILKAKKQVWETEEPEYIDTLDERREIYGYNMNASIYGQPMTTNHYESVPPMHRSTGNEIIVAADVHRPSEERRYDEIEIYATVKKNRNKKQHDIMEMSTNSDPPMQKVSNIMTQSCYGELNIPTPDQSGNWSNYNDFLIKSSENLLDEGLQYNISSLMTGTTNSSIIDGTSSMNSSIYEQIPSMNSSLEMSMKNSMTKSGTERNRVKWWDLTEETATEIQEIVDQGECFQFIII